MGGWSLVVMVVGVVACSGGAGDVAPDGADTNDTNDTSPQSDAAETTETTETTDTSDSADTSVADVLDVGTDTSDTLEADTGPGPDDGVDAVDVSPASGAWTWSQLADLPRVIQEHAVVALAGEVVLLGGFENLALVDDVVHYDPSTGLFREGTPLPRPLHHVNAAVVDDRVWVLGALEGFAFSATSDVWVFEPTSATWEPKTRMENGRQRGSAGVAVVEGDVYLVGGFRAGAVDDCDVYRVAEDRWERLMDLPGARDHGGAQAVGGMIYAVGGRRGGIASIEHDLWRLDPKNPGQGWIALSPMPTARGGFALGVVQNQLIVVGGEGNAADPSGVFAQAELYDPALDRWFGLPAMPAPRHGMQAVAIGDTLFVPGGADVEAFAATRRFSALTLE